MSDEKKGTNNQKEKENPTPPPPRPTEEKDLNSEHNRPKIRNEKE
jgi:hypothetical protein